MTIGLFKKREEPLAGIAKVYHDTTSYFNEVINDANSACLWKVSNALS